MRFLPTQLEGVLLIEPRVFADARGFFLETYRQDAFAAAGITHPFVQDNHSRSQRGVIRALHFQTSPGQAKLVRVARGAIYDVTVDLRRASPTFGRWQGIELDDARAHMLYVPVGFAHGFATVSEIADVAYKVSSVYDPATEKGLAWDDPDLAITWPVATPILSQRDRENPRLRDLAAGLPW